MQPASYPSRAQDFGVPHLLALAGWVERETGVEPVVLDLRHERDPDRALQETIDSSGPVVVGISCYSSFDYLDAVETARKARAVARSARIVVGGYHASACPEDFTCLPGLFDHVVVGDGERALAEVVRFALGGGDPPPPVMPAGEPVEPGDLPPYPFHLLERYRGIVRSRRVKLQINLSRGCPHRCAFCMERAKPDRTWRALEPARAIEEIRRLDAVFPLRESMLHVTDPLFGMRASWRREFLSALASTGPRLRSAWTLTRSEGLEEEDLRLLKACGFSIGIGLESGSHEMLRIMRKTERPEEYLDGFLRLRDAAERTGLTWAVNVLVGHPGETEETITASLGFLERLFPTGAPSRGWLSVDPFRLYPGSDVHRRMEAYREKHGSRFHAPAWWRHAADRDVTAELVDPSWSLDAFARLDAAFTRYRSIVLRVCDAFRCDDGTVSATFARSLEEQRKAFSLEAYERRRAVFGRLHPAAGFPRGAPAPAIVEIPRLSGDADLVRLALREAAAARIGVIAIVGGRKAEIDPVLRLASPGPVVRRLRARPGLVARLLLWLHSIVRRDRSGQSLGAALALRAGGANLLVYCGAHRAVPPAAVEWLRRRMGRRVLVAVGPRFREHRVILLTSDADGVHRRTVATGRFPPAAGDAGWTA